MLTIDIINPRRCIRVFNLKELTQEEVAVIHHNLLTNRHFPMPIRYRRKGKGNQLPCFRYTIQQSRRIFHGHIIQCQSAGINRRRLIRSRRNRIKLLCKQIQPRTSHMLVLRFIILSC